MKLRFTEEELELLFCALEYTLNHHFDAEDELDINLNSDLLMSLSSRISIAFGEACEKNENRK